MASPRIQVIIDATADGLRKGVAQARGALDGLDDKLAGVGKSKPFAKLDGAARQLAEDRLGPLGDAASLVGIEMGGMSTATLAGGAAVAGLGAFVAQGVGKLNTLVESVRKFQGVSGATWEDSSRLVEVMGDLGIGADQGAAAMARLGKNIDAGRLEEFGIAAVIADDGTTDLIGTLGAVADQFVATSDPAERAAMASAIFGKSWMDLVPVLSRGSAGIRQLTGDVSAGKIVTQQMSDEQFAMKMAMDDLGDSIDDIQVALAKGIIPTITDSASVIADGTTALGFLIDGYQKSTKAVNDFLGPLSIVKDILNPGIEAIMRYNKWVLGLVAGHDKGKKAAEGAADATDDFGEAAKSASPKVLELARADADLAKAAKDAAQAVKDKKAALDAAMGVVQTVAGATLAYEEAVATTTEADQGLAEKAKEAAEAVRIHGEKSDEAVKGKQDYAAAVRDAEQAAISEANAAVEQARQLAIASGQTFTAEQANLVFKEALGKVRERVTDPALQAGLDQLATLTQIAAENAQHAANMYYAAEAAASRFAAVQKGANVVPGMGIVGSPDRLEGNATGGNVSGGTPYMVGEAGPELFVPQSNGRILTADDLARVGGSAAGGVTINVNTPIGRPDDVVRWIREELRRADRAQR